MTMNPLRRAVRIALIYLLFGTLWILGSDAYLESLNIGTQDLIRLQSLKGALFVVVTGMIFFFLAYRELARQYEADMAAARRHNALQAMFEATFEHAAVGMAHVARDGRFLRVNKACCDMFGYSRDELFAMSFQDIAHPEDREPVLQRQQETTEGDTDSVTRDKRFLRKDGATIWATVATSRVPDPAGVDEYYFAVINDVSARKAADDELRASESRFRAIYEGVNDAILILDPEDGSIIDMNHRAGEISGYSVEEMRRLRLAELSIGEPEKAERIALKRIKAALRGRPQIFEWHVRSRDQRAVWVEINMRVAHIGGVPRILVLARDITDRRASEAKLRLTRQVFNSTREGVLVTDIDGRIVSVNPAFTEITGYTEEEALGRTPRLLQSGMHDRSFYQAMWQSIERSDHWQGELWNRRKSGETYPEWLTISAVRNEQGVITNYVGVFSDISRIKHSEAEVQRLAHYDALTGLPNRVLLMTRLEHALDICKRRGHRTVLLCCGLDRFKYINDSLGYTAGDELLQALSRRIRSRLQRGDTIARFSGDEFVVLREASREEEDVAHLAESILELGASPVELSDGQHVFIGISVGISVFPDDGDDPDSLVTKANTAMQQAKSEGRHTYRFYKQELTDAARARLRLESRLRRAIEQEHFQLFYQPIVDVRSGRITGAEALLRWIDLDLGMIMPDRFTPVAEETALIVPLGRWVLETACRQAVEWTAAGHDGLRVAVNLSSRQFEAGTLNEEVATILEASGADPARLELEITESMLMEQGAHSMETLKSLRRTGIGVSIDDFGTGYSSLAYLKRFAISRLKIDRMFIKELPDDYDDAEIVAAIIAMAHNLNLKVIAEGVETPGQLKFLEGLGCDEFQGYLVSPPVPAQKFVALLS